MSKEKILLGILPYWDPMIPPNGIAHLKSYLQKYGYTVKTVDVIVEEKFQEIYRKYFKLLEEFVPYDHRGNFYNIGHDVMQDHMMAHYNYDDEREYLELVKWIVYYTFYVRLSDSQARRLNRLLDEFYDELTRYFLGLLEKETPGVVGLTTYKCTLPASLFALRLTKQRYPHIKTVIGGGTFVDTHSMGSPNFVTLLEYSKDFLDKIIIGQGEKLFLKYLQGELPGSKRVYTKADINGEILEFPEAVLPDFSDFDLQKYPYLTGTGTASCPYECSFCCARNFYGRHRIKDASQTVAEMIELQKRHGRQLFFMTDSMINPIANQLANQFIKQGAAIYYDAYSRVDEAAASIENTMLWRRSGLYRVRLGTESGSQRVLDLMDKRITPDLIKENLSCLATAGIKTTAYWVIGHPGETEADFQKTLDLIEEMKDDIYQSECNPFLYYYETQNDSLKWADQRMLLYPGNAKKMLIFNTWTLKLEPVREEVYQRMYRFELHCRNVGIPNPYSFDEYIKSDERWKRLHKNAVPPLLDFLSGTKTINENKNIKLSSFAKNTREEDDEFEF